MQDPGRPPPTGPGVCPFVALVGDRDRRADGPDAENRCYAEPAPRQRDALYQADYCYSPDFAACTVFLEWAARNAAEPAHVSGAAAAAWAAGITEVEPDLAPEHPADAVPGTPEGGLFGPADADEADERSAARQGDAFDWVPAAAWSNVPIDERAEAEADELAAIEALEPAAPQHVDPEDIDEEADDEERTAPFVPAALPMRKRKPPLQPIRTRGSGEWIYADPPGRQPLVRRRYGIAPPALLVVLGILVVALIVFMIPSLLAGGDGGQIAAASPSAVASRAPIVTRAPVLLTPSPEPTATTPPRIRTYRVKSGDTLTSIAQRFKVDPLHLQCMNGIRRKNVVVLGARLQIPPEGYACEPGWRNAAP